LFQGNQQEKPSSQESSSETDKSSDCSEVPSEEECCVVDSDDMCSPTELFERRLLEFMLQAIDCATVCAVNSGSYFLKHLLH